MRSSFFSPKHHDLVRVLNIDSIKLGDELSFLGEDHDVINLQRFPSRTTYWLSLPVGLSNSARHSFTESI
jgi:hypothetical protein